MNSEISYCILGFATLAYWLYLRYYKLPSITRKLECVVKLLKIHESESRKAGMSEKVIAERYNHLKSHIERFLYSEFNIGALCMVVSFIAKLSLFLFITRALKPLNAAFYALLFDVVAVYIKGLYWDGRLGYLFYRSREILGEHSPSF